jgi:hypothetical protein
MALMCIDYSGRGRRPKCRVSPKTTLSTRLALTALAASTAIRSAVSLILGPTVFAGAGGFYFGERSPSYLIWSYFSFPSTRMFFCLGILQDGFLLLQLASRGLSGAPYSSRLALQSRESRFHRLSAFLCVRF